MNTTDKYTVDAEAWDNGELGQEEAYVRKSDSSHESKLEEALGLQMISIRLQKHLIDDLKFIATAHGIGYQPLIRDILSRFVVSEVKQIIRDTTERRRLEEASSKAEQKTKAKHKKVA